MDHDPGDPRVDDLRQQLRSLGYLDAGVDRFVLGAARHRRRPAAIAGLVSLRIGALAALLIGPAAALGIAGRLPGLITGPRDGFVIALYVGALFGVAVAIAALSAIAAMSWLAGRNERLRRPAALAAGLAVTLASLGYLTLWWDASTLAAHSGTLGSAWTLVALALAAAVSVLIGHAVTVAALAVSVARGTTTTPRHGVPWASWGVMTAIGVLTFCGALLLVHLTSRYDAAAPDAPSLTVVSSGIKLRLLAIDGFDPALAARIARGGRLPALDAALGLSVVADPDPSVVATGSTAGAPRGEIARAIVEFEDTRDPARLWTTIATGRPADAHAVRGLETRRVLGLQGTLAAGETSPLARALAAVTDTVRLTRPSVASREERRVKALWEVASGTGLKTAVINWWATWPAPAAGGIVLSDRATLRLEHGGELDAEIAPPDLYEALRVRWPALRQEAADRASPFNAPVLRRSAELDALHLAIARDVADTTTDLVCTYFPGLDLVQHALLSGADGTASASTIAARLATLEEYYVFLDRLLAPALRTEPGELVLVMTSPGRVQAGTSGLLTIRGVGANARARDAVARPFDIAPTILHALGVPISRELAGRALIELFSADFARRYPLRQVETYGAPAWQRAPRGAQPLDAEMIERLRSLGYLR